MSTFQKLKPYCLGALGMVMVAMVVSPEVRSAAAALVSVTNTLANPVPTRKADDPALSAFGVRVFPSASSPASFVVPADKILVINNVSGFTNGNGSALDVEVAVQFNGVSAQRIPFDNSVPSSSPYHYLKPVESFLVAQPGSTVFVSIDDSNANDFAGMNIDIHGYYVAAN